MHRIFVIFSVFLLVSCSESLDIQLDPEVKVFFSNDPEKSMRLTSTDQAYGAVNEWLREHKSGWHPTSGRYPGGVYIKSGSNGIQITTTHVILYSTTSTEPRAMYIREVGQGELSEIESLGQ